MSTSDTEAEETPAQRIERVAVELSRLAGHLSAGTARLLDLIAEFDRCGGCGMTGARSTAHYLTWRCGIALRSAQEHVRVARALERLPAIHRSFHRGEISYSKVRAMTRVATPADEDVFLNIARSGTASQLEHLVRLSRRHAPSPDDLAAVKDGRHERRVGCGWDEDGFAVLEARLPPEEGALVMKALHTAWNHLREDDLSQNREGSSRQVAQLGAIRVSQSARRDSARIALY